MADDVNVTEGSGKTVRTDDVGGSQYQLIKVAFGPSGVAVDWVAGAGNVGTGVPRFTLAADDPAVVDLAAIEVLLTGIDADTDAIKLATQILDDWDETNRAAVNIISGQVGVAAGTGTDGATVVRVSLATDIALPAGTNAIGKLAANSGVDIGDVDVTSVPTDPFGANVDAASSTGSISAKLRRLATDLAAALSGSELQVDIVGALPAGTAEIGKLAAGTAEIGNVKNSGTFAVQSTLQAGTAEIGKLAAGVAAIGKLAANSGVVIGDVNLGATDNAVLDAIAASVLAGGVTGLADGVKAITTAGTDEALLTSTACKWVLVQAQTDNTNPVAVGASGVDATLATGTGIVLYPGDSTLFVVDNVADVFGDALTNGEGFRFFYAT